MLTVSLIVFSVKYGEVHNHMNKSKIELAPFVERESCGGCVTKVLTFMYLKTTNEHRRS